MGKVQQLPTKNNKSTKAETFAGHPPAFTRYGRRYMECWNFINKQNADGTPGKTVSTKMGYGFENDKGNWNIELNALPANMRLTLCNPRPKEDGPSATS